MIPIRDVVGFWDRRHQDQSLLRSGGHISRTESENRAFYLRRIGLIVEGLGGVGGEASHARLLDAGCGKGIFAEWLADCGFAVTAIDSSSAALREARERSAGSVEYRRARLSEFTAWPPFEAVIAVDVLFHLVSDTEWIASLRNLAAHTAPGGLLAISDALSGYGMASSYIHYRSLDQYLTEIGSLGFRHVRTLSYGMTEPNTGLHIFRRS